MDDEIDFPSHHLYAKRSQENFSFLLPLHPIQLVRSIQYHVLLSDVIERESSRDTLVLRDYPESGDESGENLHK